MFPSLSFRRPEKHARSDENTYVVTIEIVKQQTSAGSKGRYKDTAVPAIALFNASSEHSWISKRFAERIGVLCPTSHPEEEDQPLKPVKLAWQSKDLGPYVHSTVFMIAPLADFDVLFAELQDDNKGPSERSVFRNGIKRGLFKKLVEDGSALRVIEAPSERLESTSLHPTLARLEAQLIQDTESHQTYHKMDASNVRSVRGLHDCSLLCGTSDGTIETKRTDSTTTSAGTHALKQKEPIDEMFPGTRSLQPENNMMVKQSRLDESDSMSSGSGISSSKNPYERQTPTQINESNEPSGSSSPKATSPVKGREEISKGFKQSTIQSSNCGLLPPKVRPMATATVPRSFGDGSINNKVRRSSQGDHPRNGHLSHTASASDGNPGKIQYAQTTVIQPIVRTSHKRRKIASGEFVADCSAFDLIVAGVEEIGCQGYDPDFWKWDEIEQKYYHIDKQNNEKLWYDPPP